jgi:hypothetical protein
MADIGFLIIGAPKAGTTSLFEYMRAHPQIHMPAEKEIYFFNMDRNYRRGWDWYLSTMSRDAPSGAICGEATTEYMSGVPYEDATSGGRGVPATRQRDRKALEEVIPRRIQRALPDVRLVCVLRDPVKRAYSHYRMMALRNVESRSFGQAIDELMEPRALEQTRIMRSRVNGYIVNGEYSRLLDGFLRVFRREQLKVIFSDDLAEQPAATVADVFGFVGVSAGFVPANVNTRYRAAAIRQRIPGLDLVTWQANLARARTARRLWHALPDRMRRAVDHAYNVANYRVEMWNALRGAVGEDVPAAVHERLAAHFRADSEALAETLGRDVPWLDSWARS